MTTSSADQRRLVTAIGLPIVETHISYVLLDGTHAYKVKKAVDLEFLDFTTLELRRFYCQEELRLNRQLAPSIYLDVVPIAGTLDAPVLEGTGLALEYALKMRQFDQEGLLSRVLARDELTSERVDEIAAEVASFHARTNRADDDVAFGNPEQVVGPAQQNFSQILGSCAIPPTVSPSSGSARGQTMKPDGASMHFDPENGTDSSASATAICTSATSPSSTAK